MVGWPGRRPVRPGKGKPRTDLEPAMNERLKADELIALIRRVFATTPADRRVGILVDLPDARTPDRREWRERRELAAGWAAELREHRAALGMDVSLVVYPNVGTNNGDLPAKVWLVEAVPATAGDLDPAAAVPLADVLVAHSVLIAPTEFSATAPLKLLGKRFGFRAATMPGFTAGMIPALRLDYGEVRRRVAVMKGLLDRAAEARFVFAVDGRWTHELLLDLRHRTAHASDGIIDQPGTAGNLPSGEAYIVPYEGEVAGEPSRSAGTLPVQFGDEVVLFAIERNRAVRVEGGGAAAAEQAEWLAAEPAYGNLAELGLGVLAELGVEPCGEILLDEKLGLHIAFGRSDHFGGQVGASQFSKPEAVVHIDRIYLPGLQPRVVPARVDLVDADGRVTELMRDGAYVRGIV
jgi:leucyl aminopeptidase (aminopeptidase T)